MEEIDGGADVWLSRLEYLQLAMSRRLHLGQEILHCLVYSRSTVRWSAVHAFPPPLIKREKEEEEVVEGTRTFLERTRWEFQFDGGHPLCECLGAVHDINCRRILMNLAQQDLLQSLNSLLTAHQAHFLFLKYRRRSSQSVQWTGVEITGHRIHGV